jgi:hypothetical protein
MEICTESSPARLILLRTAIILSTQCIKSKFNLVFYFHAEKHHNTQNIRLTKIYNIFDSHYDMTNINEI